MKKKFRIITSFLCAFLIVSLVILANYKSKAFADDAFEVGTTNLNNTAENSAKVGDQLLKPEKGWIRYDDSNSNIKYGDLGYCHAYDNIPQDYKGGQHTLMGDNVEFNFTGSRLRIISFVDELKAGDMIVTIDGKQVGKYTEKYTEKSDITEFQTLVYQIDNLSNTEHSVTIDYPNSGNGNIIDAIDIDENGTLKPYSEIKSIAVSGISLNKTTDSLEVNKTDTLTATVTPDNASNKTVKWTSSDTSIVTVDPDTGKITAGSTQGTATITATAQDGSKVSASCIVTVTKGSDPTPTPIPTPTDDSDKAALNVTMTNGQVKQYNIDMSEINKFISWYKLRLSGSGEPFYEFDITQSSSSNIKKTDYVIFDKISSFEVDDYTK